MVTLRPMTEAEYTGFYAWTLEDFAASMARAGGASLDEERANATRQLAELLPEGLQTPAHYLWKVVEATGDPIGDLWVRISQSGDDAFIFFIGVNEAQRGKGYGKQALDALDAELRRMGVTRIALNVFAYNTVAQHLYERAGYEVAAMIMRKTL